MVEDHFNNEKRNHVVAIFMSYSFTLAARDPPYHGRKLYHGLMDGWMDGRKEMFYLTTHSTHFLIYGYMASDIWLRTILIVRKETRYRHIGYTFRLAPRVLLYAPSHRQDSTYHGLCYTSRGALAGTRNSSWRIDPTTHRTTSERYYHRATSDWWMDTHLHTYIHT